MQYQRNTELWPVEMFLIAYRRCKGEIQVLVRKSANGTSKFGVGSGVPATRWMLSSAPPPQGYRFRDPPVRFEAKSFPEFPKDGQESWTYGKIDICADAFNGADAASLHDAELEEFAQDIREGLQVRLSELRRRHRDAASSSNDWDGTRLSVVQGVVDSPSCRAAIQGTLRMSGLFQRRQGGGARFVGLGKDAPLLRKRLVQSMRIYTMFPQMPYPMPPPSATAAELQEELASRDRRIKASGRDIRQDTHGRKFTHKSTPNVSNTIHGVYLTLDATGMPGLDEVPALELFGTKEVPRQWKSLQDLKVLDRDGKRVSTEDPKATFISGFIVRQLVKDGVINID